MAPSSRFVINLLSSLDPVEPESIAANGLFESYHLYTTTARMDGKLWHRLRLGFFPSKSAAEQVMAKIHRAYPEAWVALITERERSSYRRIFPGKAARAAAPAADSGTASGGAPAKGAEADAKTGFKDSIRGMLSKDSIKGMLKPLTSLVPGAAPAVAPDVEASSQAEKSVQTASKAAEAQEGKLSTEEEVLEGLMLQAERAMADGDYNGAMRLYQKVLKVKTGNRFAPQAQEFLGVARERRGDTKGATAEYKAYLLLYPKGPDADRVRQRLAVMETARDMPKKSLKKPRRIESETEFYGSFSQYYYRDQNFTDIGGNVVTRSMLSNDVDLSVRKRTPDYELSSLLVGGYDLEFLDGDNQTRLSRLYVDMLDRQRRLSARVGRQSRSTGGVLGRFDGGLFGYQFMNQATANVVVGYPTESSVIRKVDTGKYFYGLSFDMGTFADRWDFNTFYIKQNSDGITDREAVGGEARYSHPDHSVFSLVDFDIDYGELNIFLLFGNWILPDRTIINFSVDYRRSPTLTTSNALQGQNATSLSELLNTYSENMVRRLAGDRTPVSRSFMVGVSHPLNEKLEIGGDITVSSILPTYASGGVAATPATGNEYFLSTQLIGNSLLKDGDIAILGFRFSNASTANTLALNLNTRYPVTRDLRLNPRLRMSYSSKKTANDDQFKISPAIKVDYYWARRVRLEFEGAMEWTYDWYADQTTNAMLDYFMIMGYRYDF